MGRPSWVPASQWATLVSYADRYDSYPEVYAAIGWHETHWGQLGAGRQGYILGVGVPNSSTELTQFAGLTAQLNWTAPRVQTVIDRQATYAAFLTYASTVQKPGAGYVAWAKSVWLIYQQIGGPTVAPRTVTKTTPKTPPKTTPPTIVPKVKTTTTPPSTTGTGHTASGGLNPLTIAGWGAAAIAGIWLVGRVR